MLAPQHICMYCFRVFRLHVFRSHSSIELHARGKQIEGKNPSYQCYNKIFFGRLDTFYATRRNITIFFFFALLYVCMHARIMGNSIEYYYELRHVRLDHVFRNHIHFVNQTRNGSGFRDLVATIITCISSWMEDIHQWNLHIQTMAERCWRIQPTAILWFFTQ